MTFALVCDKNRTAKESAIKVLLFSVKDTWGFTLKSRMPPATNIAQVVASTHSAKQLRLKTLLGSYPEVVNYLLEKYVNDQAIANTYLAVLRYTQRASMVPMQYADDLYAKLCKGADFSTSLA